MIISSAYIFGKQLTAGQVPDPVGDFIDMVSDALTEADFAAQLYVHVVPSHQLAGVYPSTNRELYVSDGYNNSYGCIKSSDRVSYITLIERRTSAAYMEYLYALGQTTNGNQSNQLASTNEIYENGVLVDTYEGGAEIYTRTATYTSGSTVYKVAYETNVPRYEDLAKCKTHINLMKAYWASRTAENLASLKDHMDAYATFSTDFS